MAVDASIYAPSGQRCYDRRQERTFETNPRGLYRMLIRNMIMTLLIALPLVLADVSAKERFSRSTPEASPATTPVAVDCEAVYDYAVETRGFFPELSFDPEKIDDPTTLRPSQQRELADAFDVWGGKLEDYSLDDVPADAMVFHSARIDQVIAAAGAMNAMAAGNPLGVLIYTDTLDESGDVMVRESERVELACGFDVRNPPSTLPTND